MVQLHKALRFVGKDLGIEEPMEEIRKDKLRFLNRLIRAFHGKTTFTNFHVHAANIEERGFPLCNEIIPEKDDPYAAIGRRLSKRRYGLCAVLNGYFQNLLMALGYDAYLSSGSVVASPVRDFHVLIIVRNLLEDEKDSLHYVDVGIGFPTFEALHLANLPEEHQFAFHQMKLEKRNDTYFRCHYVGGKWVDFLEFVTTPRNLEFFREPTLKLIADPRCLQLPMRKFMFAYHYPQGKGITVLNLTLKVWHESTNETQVIQFENTEEAVQELPKYFPMFSKDFLEDAYRKWKTISRDQLRHIRG